MDSINILVIAPFFDESHPLVYDRIIEQISSVSPRFNVINGSVPANAEFRNRPDRNEEFDTFLAEADIIFGLFFVLQDMIARTPRLKWIQTMSAGVDRFIGTEIWDSPVMITGVSGIHSTAIGEFVLAFMLMFAKQAPQFIRSQLKNEWGRFMPTMLKDKTIGIAGLGNIGREVARLSKAFGMKVIATRRSTRNASKARYVDKLLPMNQLKELLKESDYVVVSTPLTPDTRGLFGTEEFKAMKPSAYIINIGRGGLIDEDALINALEENQIAGAGLDVTATEPLPPDSLLWDYENVIISPHISGAMEDYVQKATDVFCENLRRYLDGKKLINVVDRKRGY